MEGRDVGASNDIAAADAAVCANSRLTPSGQARKAVVIAALVGAETPLRRIARLTRATNKAS